MTRLISALLYKERKKGNLTNKGMNPTRVDGTIDIMYPRELGAYFDTPAKRTSEIQILEFFSLKIRGRIAA